MEKLISKIFIRGQIVAKTGLHIGGSKTALDIGGIDLNVIKTPAGIPYIPGSSLKGKLRSLLAREEGSGDVKNDSVEIKKLFGSSAPEDSSGNSTRLIIRDAYMSEESVKNMKNKEGIFENLELDYTESKWENTIDRKTGTAQHPRQLERVPAGAKFDFEIIYNNCDEEEKKYITKVIKAMRLLQDDFIGGSGSRGYGKIEFENVGLTQKTINIYEGNNTEVEYNGVNFKEN